MNDLSKLKEEIINVKKIKTSPFLTFKKNEDNNEKLQIISEL